ncbi:hypothetical protein C7M84_002154 [Penaeus vannamei]|uniref:Uncharacterized protein n=1 Tax=Penaeus vannamei TaxID=6689 RepID=A0A3R7P9C3_PENVA|nr:hypothetical protein C7M84_002154 [Penaeus vannamei]
MSVMTSGVPTSKMIAGVLSSVVVCALVVGTEAQVSVTGIRLTLAGQEVPFMNLGNPDLSYVLECNYVASVEDVVNVTWTLDDYGDVYSWHPSTDTVTVRLGVSQHHLLSAPCKGRAVFRMRPLAHAFGCILILLGLRWAHFEMKLC